MGCILDISFAIILHFAGHTILIFLPVPKYDGVNTFFCSEFQIREYCKILLPENKSQVKIDPVV